MHGSNSTLIVTGTGSIWTNNGSVVIGVEKVSDNRVVISDGGHRSQRVRRCGRRSRFPRQRQE